MDQEVETEIAELRAQFMRVIQGLNTQMEASITYGAAIPFCNCGAGRPDSPGGSDTGIGRAWAALASNEQRMAAKQVRNVALSMAAPFSREKQKPAAKALILRKRPFDRDQRTSPAPM